MDMPKKQLVAAVDLNRSQARSYFAPFKPFCYHAVLMLPDTFGFLDKVLIKRCAHWTHGRCWLSSSYYQKSEKLWLVN
jgi:hypothetical protein